MHKRLNSFEVEALQNHVNISFPATSCFCTYSKILICKTSRILSTYESKPTLRDNSCFVYKVNSELHYGLFHKAILYNDRIYIVFVPLLKAQTKLCSDDVTGAKLDQRIATLLIPTYVTLFIIELIHFYTI